MCRYPQSACLALLLVALASDAWGDQSGITDRDVGSLGVVDGKALLTAGPIYDPDGKDRRVPLLPPRRGDRGKQWKVTRVAPFRYTAQAAEGKFKGWYLNTALLLNPGPASPAARQAEAAAGEEDYRRGLEALHARGRPYDEAEALASFQKASEAGYPLAPAQLALFYVLGSGVTRDVK